MPRPNALEGNFKLSGAFSTILAILQKNDPQNAPRIDDLPAAKTLVPPILAFKKDLVGERWGSGHLIIHFL
jgi:hypothetical protein